jgi:hypothetical protein
MGGFLEAGFAALDSARLLPDEGQILGVRFPRVRLPVVLTAWGNLEGDYAHFWRSRK